MINNEFGKFFPPAAVAIGYIFLLVGLLSTLGNPFIGMALAAIGSIGAFARVGVQIKPDERVFRAYTALFGIATGKWQSMDGFSDIAVLKKRISTTAYSRSDRAATTSAEDYLDVCLLDKSHRKKQVINRCTDMDTAIRNAQELAERLNLNYGAYNPDLSAATIARRR
jgi:hypothetical protein